jgi:hypothetical protein
MMEVAFSWQGAVCGFVALNACAGHTLAKNTYKAYGEDETFGIAKNHNIVGTGYLLNYLLHLALVILGGGYGTGTAEASPQSASLPSPNHCHCRPILLTIGQTEKLATWPSWRLWQLSGCGISSLQTQLGSLGSSSSFLF